MIEEGIIGHIATILFEQSDPKIIEHTCELLVQLYMGDKDRIDMKVAGTSIMNYLITLLNSENNVISKSVEKTLQKMAEVSKSIPKIIQLLNSKNEETKKTTKAILCTTPILYVVSYPHMHEFEDDDSISSSSDDEDNNKRKKIFQLEKSHP